MKRDIPSHYRIANHPRTPEIMMVADLGYTITTSENARTRVISGGAHGYDHHEPEMRSFFLGYGPNLKQNSIVEPFQSIHVYELMTNLLHLTPARNNGSLDSIKTVLR
jgi:predicted AlkP superfamily pyrophosphatase or phosphodiesterase